MPTGKASRDKLGDFLPHFPLVQNTRQLGASGPTDPDGGPTLQNSLVVAMTQVPEFPDGLHVHDGRPVDPNEPVWIQACLQPLQAFGVKVIGQTQMEANIVSCPFYPPDIRNPDQDALVAGPDR